MIAWRFTSELCVLTLLATTLPTPALAQAPATATATASLAIAGDVAKPLTLTAADLRALPRTTVKEVLRDPRFANPWLRANEPLRSRF
jgi:hypothetical protein